MSKNIAIVGSGFLGMTLALRYAEAGNNVTIFESAGEIGGLAGSWSSGEHTWDKHYHVTLESDSYTRKIVDELGFGDELRWAETKTGFFTDGQLISSSNGFEFLKCQLLGPIAKARLAATILYASRVKNWRRLEKISVERWLTRLSGRRTFQRIWKPFLRARLGDAYHDTSAAYICATIQRMHPARRHGLRKEMFGYLRGGYSRVVDRFTEVLVENGVEIRLNSRVDSIEKLANGCLLVKTAEARRHRDIKPTLLKQTPKYEIVKFASTVAAGFSGAFLAEPDPDAGRVVTFPRPRTAESYDEVIVTCPPDVAAKMITGLSPRERQDLNSIAYQGMVCASVLMKCSLSDQYLTSIIDDAPFTDVIEMTTLVDKKEFGRNTLVYLPKYVAPDDPLFEKSDAEIAQESLDALGKMYTRFRFGDVIDVKISRIRQAFPIPVLNYSRDLPASKTSVDGVYIVNSSHVVNGTLNVNGSVEQAERFFAKWQAEAPKAANVSAPSHELSSAFSIGSASA